jgi:integrase
VTLHRVADALATAASNPDAGESVRAILRFAFAGGSVTGIAEDAPSVSDTEIADYPDVGGRDYPMSRRSIFGPYEKADSKKWRICIREKGKKDEWHAFDTEKEATAEALRLRREVQRLGGPSIDMLLTQYQAMRLADGNRPLSVKTTDTRLRFFFKPHLNQSVGTLSPPVCAALVKALETAPTRFRRPMQVTTRLNTVAEARTFLALCVEEHHLRANPLDGIRVRGKKARGKPQLMEDEAARLVATALKCAADGDEAAVAVLTVLVHGARASEVIDRKKRELDGGGRLLRITAAKTRTGIRVLRIAPWLQPLLLRQVDGKGPDDRIFPFTRQWLRLHTIRLCKLAGVPRVTPHGLRGTFASLDVEGSDILERTAGRLGHSSSTTTERHYATEDAVASGRASRVGANLEAALARLQQKKPATRTATDQADPVAGAEFNPSALSRKLFN